MNDQETVIVTCGITKGDVPLQFQWFFNGEKVQSLKLGVIISNGKRSSQLTIESVSHQNQGNYTCVVQNEAGIVNHTAPLYVNGIYDRPRLISPLLFILVAPIIKPFDFGAEPANDQEAIMVICSVTKGDMPFVIQWYFNGQAVRTGRRGIVLLNTKRSSQISIESVSHENQGNYTCVVKNEAGVMNYTATLFVNGIIAEMHFNIFLLINFSCSSHQTLRIRRRARERPRNSHRNVHRH